MGHGVGWGRVGCGGSGWGNIDTEYRLRIIEQHVHECRRYSGITWMSPISDCERVRHRLDDVVIATATQIGAIKNSTGCRQIQFPRGLRSSEMKTEG